MPKTPKPGEDTRYGEAASRLEAILLRIEEGQVDIDELSSLVEEAAALVALCRDKIHAAEVKVRTITEQLERETPEESSEAAAGDDAE